MAYRDHVANAFLEKCQLSRVLKPADYAIIAEWEKQRIPLELVLDSISEVCAEIKGGPDGIESFDHFESAVRKNFGTWLRAGCDI